MLWRNELKGVFDHLREFLCRLDAIRRDVDDPDENVFSLQQPQQLERDLRMDAFERDLLDAAFRQRREDLLVLAPLRPERLLPVEIGLDAVAVADMHDRRAFQPLNGALEGGNAPFLDVGHVDIEGRLSVLDY